MSCAHSFGEWCQECNDGLVRDYNRVRAKLRASIEENVRLRAALENVMDALKACEADEDALDSGMWCADAMETARAALSGERKGDNRG
jgi:regulator of replication initiation timing